MLRMISAAKAYLVPGGSKPRTVDYGLYRGLTMEIDFASQTQLYLGMWERETHTFIRRVADEVGWAIDVGAGRGELCLFLLKASRVAKIYAFEPQPSETDVFCRNLSLNGLETDSRLVISNNRVGTVHGTGVTALDSLELNEARRGFVKIDVDGAEYDVLESGRKLFARGKMDVLIETHSESLEAACLEFLRKDGYHCTLVSKAWWRAILPELRPLAHNRWICAVRN